MRPFQFPVFVTCLCALLGAAIAPAPARAEGPTLNLERLGLTTRDQRTIGSDRTRALSRYYSMALAISPDGVVTREMYDAKEQVQKAQARGRLLGTYLGFDLNGDQKISKEEFRLQAKLLAQYQLSSLLILRDTGDTDGDGAVDLPEMIRAADRASAGGLPGLLVRRNDLLMKMDVNGDGKVTLTEIDQVVTAVTGRQSDEGQGSPIGQPRVVPPTKL